MQETVVFDLGGVLARICHTWQEALSTAAVESTLPAEPPRRLMDLPTFDAYQAGEIELDTYLDSIAEYTGCDRSEALHVHNSIIIELYPGVSEIVDELHAKGYKTGCLSNTNPPHWEELAFADRFHAIRNTEYKMASHLVGLNKPDPRIFKVYCETFNLKPENIVYFDDFLPNVEGAKAVGFRAHRIDPHEPTAPQIRGFLAVENVL